jgi:serine/threonine protein phosphatase PrpC
LHTIVGYYIATHLCLLISLDGHGGCAASKTASQGNFFVLQFHSSFIESCPIPTSSVLPSLFALELQVFPSNTSQALVSAWNKTCETYRDGCSLYGSCVADYDPREGIIFAEHGAKDLVAGTTASIIAMDHETGSVTILNCGDSRTIIFSDMPVQSCNTLHSSSYIHFATRDHKPSDEHEMRRLREGKVDGYAQPECSLSRYWITVGDYQYAVSRSLEGRVATESGIISDADITQLNLSKIMPDGFTYGAVVVATDGLFDVMSDQEVASVLIQMMKDGMQADEASKVLCMLAHKKGSSDNISVIIVTLK